MIKKANNLSLELNPAQLEELINRLPLKEKIRLLRGLQKQTWAQRMDQVLKNIDARRKQYPISQKEIDLICKEARQETYAKRRR